MKFPKPYADLVQRLRVASGLALASSFFWLAKPTVGRLIAGAVISAGGLLLRAWAAGHLAKNERLATSGPYAWVRNPLYLGSVIAAAGLALAGREWLMAMVFALVFVLIYLPAIQLEEEHLGKLFSGYERYARRVPFLLPRPPSGPREVTFSPGRYMRNQEYKALAAWLVALVWLWWRLPQGQ
ncbi:MAG: methyltransferase family protein [Bryobacteraceae bacterium]